MGITKTRQLYVDNEEGVGGTTGIVLPKGHTRYQKCMFLGMQTRGNKMSYANQLVKRSIA